MKTIVIEATPCPSCGKPMPAGALAGLCPACLLAQGVGTDAGDGRKGVRFEPPSVAEVARLFPQLEILGLLGAGGMGAVYKARQPVLDRMVALKILPASGAEGVNFEERFNREARALARLNHPNIVAVHEFGKADSLHFFIMEFVDGANLRQLEHAGRLAPREALQIIPQICDALQYAHDEGVVHRDIKPENVLIDRKGRVKIADFGLAKILGVDAESLRLTAEGQVMGTPHYMAPEQVERPLTVDHRADIYSLGVVFYEMLTGDLPLGKFSPPSRKFQLDVRLDEVVLRALENDPARRYQNASEVKSQLETIAGTPAPVAAAPVPEERHLYWAGFPIVVERDGQRTVSKKERLRAWAIIFGLLTIAFAFVSAVAGRSLMGWLGIHGVVSLVVRAGLAALVVAWGVRRALSQPPIPGGGVILKPKTPWWRSRHVVAASLLLLALTWTVCRERAFLSELIKRGSNPTTSAPPPMFQAATQDPETGALVARLPGGGTVALLAVSEENDAARPQDAARAWWLPDGSRIPDTRYEVLRYSFAAHKCFIFQARDLPKGASGPAFVCAAETAGWGRGPVHRNGEVLEGAYYFRGKFSSSISNATVVLGFGLGPWRTISICDAQGRLLPNKELPQLPDLQTQVLQVDQEDGVPRVKLLANSETQNWNVRVVEVDTNGVEHACVRGSGNLNHTDKVTDWADAFSGSPSDKVTTWSYPYRDPSGLRPGTREFRVQARPLHWVEFDDVALQGQGMVQPLVSAELWSPTLAPGEKPDLHRIQTEAGEMMKRGDYEPALQRHIWLHNHALEVDNGMSAVRVSFYLSWWVELGRRYPRARQALIEVRDLKTREFDEGRGHSQLFQDVQSINSYLNADDATAALFKRIHKLDPTLARKCIHYARTSLVKNHEYELCLSYIPDVQADFESHKRNRERDLASDARNPSMQAPQYRKSTDARFVAGVSQLIEMLNGVGRVAEAERMRAQAKAIVDDAGLWAAASTNEEGLGGKKKITIVSKVEPWPAPKMAGASLETWTPAVNPGESLDVYKLLDEARAMITARDYESALQRFIWIHNHAIQYGGDALGGLSDWIELGRRFPKARQALIEIRDFKAYQFEKNQGYSELFGQVWMINKYLGEEDATPRLFIRIHQLDPALAQQCVGFAREGLLKRKEYMLCLSYIPDAQADFMSYVKGREMEQQFAAKNSFMNTPSSQKSTDVRFITGVSQLMEMLNAVGRAAEAENIRTQAIAIVDAPEFRMPAK